MKGARGSLCFALIMGVVAGAYGMFGIRAHDQRFQSFHDRVLVAHRRVREEEDRSAHLEQLLADVAWLRASLDAVRLRMQHAEGASHFLFGLAEVLQSEGLAADAIEPSEVVSMPPLLKQTIKLEVRGSFAQILRVIGAVESLEPHARVSAIEVERAVGLIARIDEAPDARVRAKLSVTCFWSAEP
jgi:Tfp pilus assembly protein PilO